MLCCRGKKLLVNWHVSIIKESTKEIVCTGVRLDENWIIVTASCIVGKIDSKSWNEYKAIVGYLLVKPYTNEARVRTMRKLIIHPQYKGEKSGRYDVGLVELTALNKPAMVYADSPCIMSRGDLLKSLKEFKIGTITTSIKSKDLWPRPVSITPRKTRLAPKFCTSGWYICSRPINTETSAYHIEQAPVYVRYGISDTDWGLAGLTTAKWRRTKSGKSRVRKHIPLYVHVDWFEHIMREENR